MSPRQQEPGTSSQSRGTNRQLSVNVSPDAQLIRDHIPHFASLIDKKHQKNQAGTGEDPFAKFVENSGRISERVLDQKEMSTKDKAYQDIQDARGYNTSKSYCVKQVEFLRFCEMRYANRPLATRHQATGDKLLAFLYEKINKKSFLKKKKHLKLNKYVKVINRKVRKSGTKHIKALGNSAEEEVSEINKTDAIHKK
ncbi:uncharacterized protein ATC70_000180 [Mucor velutinosus]|uniref:Uncharacterized protein n=1 Tax=Mucor velutinosus TaxID=708070 RepID=A0AAN7DLG9_9FUNG|nr:hypothetical protein ATC70_000180 [Mucor velutinosus]